MTTESISPVPVTEYDAADENPSSTIGTIDTAYDQAISKPPAGGWSAKEQATIDEINSLEAKENLTVAEQLRLSELKLSISNAAGTVSPESHESLSASLKTLTRHLNRAMTTGVTDPNFLNSVVFVLELNGFNTAGSPLVAKRDSSIANPEMPLAEGLRFHAQYYTELAESLPEGSPARERFLNRALYLNEAADMESNHSGSLGTSDITQYDSISFTELSAIDQGMLEAEAIFFGELAAAREAELRRQHAGNPDVENIVASDPVLNYYRGREALATDTAAALAGDVDQVDVLNTRMDYLSKIAKMDQAFYSDMADLAKHHGDADLQRQFESYASEASDREGQINRSWQTLMNMLTQAMVELSK